MANPSYCPGLDTPPVVRLVLHAGDQGDDIVIPGIEHRKIRCRYFGHRRHFVFLSAYLGGQLDLRPHLEVVDLPEVAVDTSVVPGDGHVAVPNAGLQKSGDRRGD